MSNYKSSFHIKEHKSSFRNTIELHCDFCHRTFQSELETFKGCSIEFKLTPRIYTHVQYIYIYEH